MKSDSRQVIFTEADFKNWEPFSLIEAFQLFKGLDIQWCFAGGYAIEQFVGEAYRPHGDIDILIKRQDQAYLRQYLKDWDLYKGTRPGMAYWELGTKLEKRVYDIWGRADRKNPWKFQVMLLDTEGDYWLYKRNPKIRGPLSELAYADSKGMPYLAPAIQLLYKSKLPFREKDSIDFEKALPLLSQKKRIWLVEMIKDEYPNGHPWLVKLNDFNN